MINFDDSKSYAARGLWLGLKSVLFVLSAATSGAFFMTYAGQIFAGIVGPELSPYFAALAGVIVFDGAALVWSYLRSNHANTESQMTIARFTGMGDLIGSLLTTVLYLALSSSFSIGVYDAAGSLTILGQTLHYTGLVLVVVGVGGNFAAAYLYADADIKARLAQHARRLEAQANEGNFIIDQERGRLTAEKKMASVMSKMGALTDQEANRQATAYLTSAGTDGTPQNEPEESEPARPSPNGKPERRNMSRPE